MRIETVAYAWHFFRVFTHTHTNLCAYSFFSFRVIFGYIHPNKYITQIYFWLKILTILYLFTETYACVCVPFHKTDTRTPNTWSSSTIDSIHFYQFVCYVDSFCLQQSCCFFFVQFLVYHCKFCNDDDFISNGKSIKSHQNRWHYVNI